jgi:hypothetical protein
VAVRRGGEVMVATGVDAGDEHHKDGGYRAARAAVLSNCERDPVH